MSEKPQKGGYIRQAWLVILLALIYGGALAGLQTALKDQIDANKEAETIRVVPLLLCLPPKPVDYRSDPKRIEAAEGDAGQPPKYKVHFAPVIDGQPDESQKVEVTVEKLELEVGSDKEVVYKATTSDGALLGWVVAASGQGFADRIEVLIGFDPKVETIRGLYVLDQKETPGLGNLIQEPAFCNKFVGKSTLESLMVVKGTPSASYEIDAVSGATISSESVVDIVNVAIERLKVPIQQLASDTAAGTSPTPVEPN